LEVSTELIADQPSTGAAQSYGSDLSEEGNLPEPIEAAVQQTNQKALEQPLNSTNLERARRNSRQIATADPNESESNNRNSNKYTPIAIEAGEGRETKKDPATYKPNPQIQTQQSVDMREQLKSLDSGTKDRPVPQPRAYGNDIAHPVEAGKSENLSYDSSAPTRAPLQVAEVQYRQNDSAEIGSTPKAPEGSVSPRMMETDLIRQIVQRMTLNTTGNSSSVQIKLKPEFLGNVRMQIATEDQKVMIRITAETQQVKDIIERHIHILKSGCFDRFRQ
jgi:flagellar hook-length control protein FliK